MVLSLAAGAQQPPATPPAGSGQQQGQGRGGRQAQAARDRAQTQPQGTAAIGGRVLTADTGRPVKRARVTISGGGRQGRSTSTDDQGRYQVTDLPAGTYTITASKAGYVDSAYGQRRPMQPGTPLELVDAQQATGIDLRLIRGGVITGRVLDEDGEPIARALVTVERYQYVRGERQLVPMGADQSDDRGIYRVFGLPPGDYFVNGNAASLLQMLGRGLPGLAAALNTGGGGRGGRGGGFGALLGGPPTEDTEPVGYAPTYYPGVVSAAEAMKVTVGPGQEAGGIDFQIQLVPTATVRGLVVGGEGAAAGVGVMLVPSTSTGLLRAQPLRGGTQGDGTFTISNVPPGRYTAIARSFGPNDEQRIALQPVTVSGENITGLSLVLQSGVSVAGNIVVESAGTPAPTDYSSFRVDIPDVEPLPFGPGGGRGGGPNGTGGRVAKNGSFTVDNLLPGKHFIRVAGQGVWTMKSVSMAGRDVTDQPVELRSGQDVDNVTIVVTDRTTDLSGTVRSGTGDPVSAVTVIAFSSDSQFWRAQSRQIQAVRTGQNGAYQLRGLPPGDYLIVAVDDVETGEWYDPAYLEQIRPNAQSLTLRDGDKKTLELRGPS